MIHFTLLTTVRVCLTIDKFIQFAGKIENLANASKFVRNNSSLAAYSMKTVANQISQTSFPETPGCSRDTEPDFE